MEMLLENWLYITSRILPVGLDSFYLFYLFINFKANLYQQLLKALIYLLFRSNTSLSFGFIESYLWPERATQPQSPCTTLFYKSIGSETNWL